MNRANIVRASTAVYCLPLQRVWTDARGEVSDRRGWLVRLETQDGSAGYGDCAPPPLTASADEQKLGQILEEVTGRGPEGIIALVEDSGISPAVRCAIESAVLDLRASEASQPLARYLDPRAPDSVPANAAVGVVDDGLPARAASALAAGYRVLKIKVGASDLQREIRGIRLLAGTLSDDISLRLDANGAWDEPRAREFILALGDLPVDSLEEPVGDGNYDALRRLQALAPWPLALDQSLAGRTPDQILAGCPVGRLVLKPMLLGGALATLRLARRAQAAGLEAVVTTTVDSAAGSWLAAHTAAAVGGGLAHGLGTSEWLAQDTGTPPMPMGGVVALPGGPGLGFRPFETVKFELVAEA